jgi:hypothetical protein
MSKGKDECRIFFELNAKNPKKVELLQLQDARVEWENLSASSYSSHPVHIDENLARVVFNPIHVDAETGGLKPSAVSDVKDKGCSVNRLSFISIVQSIADAQAIAALKNKQYPERPTRRVCGVAKLAVSDVRSISVGDMTRAFGVYDTALENNRSHADICQLVSEKNKQQSRSARLQLFELVNRGLQTIS